MIEETADKCPFCGATNNAVKRTADKTPKQSPNYSSGIRTDTCRRMRQQDFLLASIIRNQKHLVFIRMATSSLYTKQGKRRTCIRYQGTDEAYAVNELYLKLKSEILNQKANNQTRKQQQTLTREQKKEKRKTYSSLLQSFLPALWG